MICADFRRKSLVLFLGFPFAITNHLGNALFRGVAVSTACVITCRKPATQAQSRQKSSKNLRLYGSCFSRWYIAAKIISDSQINPSLNSFKTLMVNA